MAAMKPSNISWIDQMSKVLNINDFTKGINEEQRKHLEKNKDLHNELTDLVSAADELKEKICSAMKKSLLNESLKEEEESLIHSKTANSNNKDATTDHQHRGRKPPSKTSKALNTTSINLPETHPQPKSINKPAGLTQIDFESSKNEDRNLLQKEIEQLRRDLAERDKIIGELRRENANLKISLDNIKKNFIFESIEGIAKNIYLFNEKLLELKNLREQRSQNALLDVFKKSINQTTSKASNLSAGFDLNSAFSTSNRGPQAGEIYTPDEEEYLKDQSKVEPAFEEAWDEIRKRFDDDQYNYGDDLY